MLSQSIPAALVSGAASLVEFIEALTVVLALGATRSWRSSLCGSAAALVLLALLLALFGRLLARVPAAPVQLVLGVLSLLFGTRWLRKATRRAAGLLPLRDERASLRRHEARFAAMNRARGRWDAPALAISFQATAFEGLEVVFIVVAVGAAGPGQLAAAAVGAAGALVLVCGLGAVLHGPVTRVPENTLKRLVGAVMAGLGTFWIGDGIGVSWPGSDLAVLPLGLGFLLLSAAAAPRLRSAAARRR